LNMDKSRMQTKNRENLDKGGQDPEGEVLSWWKSALDSDDDDQRVLAAMMLGKPGPDVELRTRWLSGVLNDPSPEVQRTAIESLRRLGDGGNLIVLAEKLLTTTDVGLCQTIVRSLLEAENYPARLMRILDSAIANDEVQESARAGVVSILGTAGEGAVLPLCRALTSDSSVKVRRIAALGLRESIRNGDLPSAIRKKVSDALAFAVSDEGDKDVLDVIIEVSRLLREGGNSSNKPVARDSTKNYGDPGPKTVEKDQGVTGREKDTRSDRTKVERIKELLNENAPEAFAKTYAKVAEVMLLTRREMAERLSGPLSAKVHRMPQETYEQKKSIASWVNSTLREVGLAIRCPKTGRPAILIADIRNSPEDSSRFRLEITDEDGRKVRTWTGSNLTDLELELREDEPRKEGPTIRRHQD
jgi:hypothetical protein